MTLKSKITEIRMSPCILKYVGAYAGFEIELLTFHVRNVLSVYIQKVNFTLSTSENVKCIG